VLGWSFGDGGAHVKVVTEDVRNTERVTFLKLGISFSFNLILTLNIIQVKVGLVRVEKQRAPEHRLEIQKKNKPTRSLILEKFDAFPRSLFL
jgi:hypothetical protein